MEKNLRSAGTPNVIAPVTQLDHGLAIVALLPCFSCGHPSKVCICFVNPTRTAAVPLLLALSAGVRIADPTKPFPTSCSAVDFDILRFNPPCTPLLRTVEAVLSAELQFLLVEACFEVVVEEIHDVSPCDRGRSTAARRHELFVLGREFENALETVVAHVVSAC